MVDKEADSHIEWSVQVPDVRKIADDVTTTLDEMTAYLASVSSEKIDQQIVDSYETQLTKTMNPLSKVGAEFRTAIINAHKNDVNGFILPSEVLYNLQSLDDTQLVELGLMVSAIVKDETIIWEDGRMVSYERVVDCLMEATGIIGIIELFTEVAGGCGSIGLYISGTKMLMNSTALINVLKGLGLRYLGVVGMAYTIYKFGKCMRG